ncbi:restriction endonuclease subunit S [Streptococcus pseudopneumoniae]|nr:restriction endonuclease subunit S [Streptococcus pseudopneumoniae]TMR42893.1 restriction endonuclease subunit S [Streptococcus pseudopneumoniae]
MTIIFLQNIFEKSINGEWGNEDSGKGEATAVIRTSNFLNSGRLNLDNIVCREIDKDKNSDKILRTGDIIIEKSGGSPNQPVGRVVYFDVTDQDYFTNNFTSILRVKPGYNSKYIFYLMKYLYDTKKVLKFQNQTTGIINLKLADYLNKTKVNIETIENQNTIVDILDRLEYQIINRNKQLSELSNLVKSRFNEMFGDFYTTLFPKYKIGEKFEVSSGSTPSRDNKLYWDSGTINWVKTTEVINREITETEEKITKFALENTSLKLFPVNTILIAMYGQGQTRGRSAILKVESTSNQACGAIFPNKIDNPVFIWHQLMLRYSELRELGRGGNQPNLNGQLIKNFELIFPPLALQNEFADFVAQVDKSQLAIQKSLEELETLKKSLMQEYFS